MLYFEGAARTGHWLMTRNNDRVHFQPREKNWILYFGSVTTNG